MSDQLMVEVKDLIKLYEIETKNIRITALRGIELEINQGDLVSIVGPSGSGKTTLIKMIAGIEKPSAGSVRVGDTFVHTLNDQKLTQFRRKYLGFMWQFPERNLVSRFTALQNVMLPMQIIHKGTRSERIKWANELLDTLGLSSRKNATTNKLSGGEAQRVALAAALANKPKLILADEPTGELDSVNAGKIISYLKELNKELGQTIIVVTHDQRFTTMTEKTFKMRDGALYGIHRRLEGGKELSSTGIWEREHLMTIDSLGTIRLPKEMVEEAELAKYIKVSYNSERGCVEIFPVKK
jgi:ABC-type lipoprotein export system ATPase subunit